MESTIDILSWQSVQPRSPAEQLEQHDIATFVPCPFALPDGDDRQFLFGQRRAGMAHRAISYDPATGVVSGFVRQSEQQDTRLTEILKAFSVNASTWLGQLLPEYAKSWRPDRVSFRPEEQATRKVCHDERDDLLHIDAFAGRPTQGHRILRLIVNLHPSEPRVWTRSESFADVLNRFGHQLHREPAGQWTRRFRQALWNWFNPREQSPSAYDVFMIRLQHFLRDNDEFQEKARRKFERFAPGAAWLAFTDGFCHADLRGQFALEHSFFVDPRDLFFPELAPVNLWRGLQASRTPAQAA